VKCLFALVVVFHSPIRLKVLVDGPEDAVDVVEGFGFDEATGGAALGMTRVLHIKPNALTYFPKRTLRPDPISPSGHSL
jgi:hypothetical protein